MPEQRTGTGWGILRAVLLIVVTVLVLAAAGNAGYHWFRAAKAEDTVKLARLAERYLETEPLQVERTEQKGDYLAALCVTEKGRWCLCEYERDRVWRNRWRARGGQNRLRIGELSSWNYRSPQGDAVLIFFGCRLREQAYWYAFRSDGVLYISPVRDDPLLDIFVLPDSSDISAVPTLLGKDYQPLAN